MHAKILDNAIHLFFGHGTPLAYPTSFVGNLRSSKLLDLLGISMAPRAGVKPKRTGLELVGVSGLQAGPGGADTVTDTVRPWEESVAASHGTHRWNRDRSWSGARACRR